MNPKWFASLLATMFIGLTLMILGAYSSTKGLDTLDVTLAGFLVALITASALALYLSIMERQHT